MSFRSGSLVRRVELWKKTSTKNSFGEYTEVWSKSKDLRSYTYKKSGAQTEANDEIFDLIRLRIRVRNQHDIDEQDRIKYYGNMYQIEFIQPDESRRWLMIFCNRINE